jgi:hypothetical protein
LPKEFALLPPVILDTISTSWLLETGNDLVAHYTFGGVKIERTVKREAKRGFAPSLKSPPPLLPKERGIKGVRFLKIQRGNHGRSAKI